VQKLEGASRPPETMQAQQACAEDFEAFFHRHDRRVFGYLFRITGNEQAAYDLSQETFVRAWQRFREVSTYQRPDAWLLRVATNLALNERRRHRALVGAATPLEDNPDPASSDPTVRLAERDLVYQALMELPARLRAALVLREVHGFSCAEVGQALGISRAAAKMTIFRARTQFRSAYLAAEGEV
jgi:RNA polymerase sigma-70 factor (ECF subfamily)